MTEVSLPILIAMYFSERESKTCQSVKVKVCNWFYHSSTIQHSSPDLISRQEGRYGKWHFCWDASPYHHLFLHMERSKSWQEDRSTFQESYWPLSDQWLPLSWLSLIAIIVIIIINDSSSFQVSYIRIIYTQQSLGIPKFRQSRVLYIPHNGHSSHHNTSPFQVYNHHHHSRIDLVLLSTGRSAWSSKRFLKFCAFFCSYW